MRQINFNFVILCGKVIFLTDQIRCLQFGFLLKVCLINVFVVFEQ
jgi:hypothetical protein